MADEAVHIPQVTVDVAQVLQKPRLEAVLFCEYANRTEDEKTNLSGIFERIFVNRETKLSGGFFLFVRLAEAGEGPIQIVLLDPANKPVLGIGADLSGDLFKGNYPKMIQVLDRVAFQATELGVYWLDVSYKGESLGGAPLIVEMRPEAEKKMSTNQATFSDSFDFDLSARGVAVRAAKVMRYFGVQSVVEPAETSAAEVPTGLASLLGKYNADPSWEDFPAFLEQYRREMDETNRE